MTLIADQQKTLSNSHEWFDVDLLSVWVPAHPELAPRLLL